MKTSWLNKGDTVNIHGEPCVIIGISGPNFFGQVVYEVKPLDVFWAEYAEHGNGD